MTGAGIEARFCGTVGTFAVDIAFTVPARGVAALFGPSGCGKTTALRCIAGLTRLPGRFALDGEVWQDARHFRPPHARPIGYVFQEASLFPHMSVRDNLLYGHRRAHRAGLPEVTRFDEVIDLLGIERLLVRAPAHLSGGERQRVAIGRALLSQPRLLLMDEPLAALDRFSKDEILPYLERLRDTLSVPVLYVSHDIAEVERLSDHLVLMARGCVQAAGPRELLQSDPQLPLARLPEAGVTLAARVTGHDTAYGLTTLTLPGGTLQVPGALGPQGTILRIRVAASDVSLARQPFMGSSILNILPGRIVAAEPQAGMQVMVVIALGPDGCGAKVLARISRRSWDTLHFAPGQMVFAQIKGVALTRPGSGSEAPPLRAGQGNAAG